MLNRFSREGDELYVYRPWDEKGEFGTLCPKIDGIYLLRLGAGEVANDNLLLPINLTQFASEIVEEQKGLDIAEARYHLAVLYFPPSLARTAQICHISLPNVCSTVGMKRVKNAWLYPIELTNKPSVQWMQLYAES